MAFASYWQNLLSAHEVNATTDVSATSFADLDKGIDASWLSSAWGPSYFAPDAKTSLGDWRAAPLPQWTAGANVAANWGGSTYPVFTQSKHPKEAAEFSEWMNATDASWNITKTAPSSLFPTYLPLLNSSSYKTITVPLSGSSTPGVQFTAAASQIQGVPWPPFLSPRRDERLADAPDGVQELPERPGELRQGAGLHGLDVSTVTVTDRSAASAGRRRRGRSAWIQRRDRRGIWFVVPFLVGFVLFMIVPLVYAIYTSLYTTKIIGGTVFSGASNYTQTLQSSQFWSGVVRVIIYAAIQIPVMLAIAFFFACVFDLGVAKFGRTFRTIFFIPFAVPAVVGAVMWSFLLEPQFGPMVHLANAFGFSGTNFFSPSLILPSIIVIVIWEWTGYNMVILYTALKSVPRDVVEAAILDDTPLWRIIIRIKLPLVRPAIVMLIFLNTIGALQLFTEPLILSYFETGSVSVNYTPTLYLYNTAIAADQTNLAAAGAVILGLVIVAISTASLLFRRRRGEFR